MGLCDYFLGWNPSRRVAGSKRFLLPNYPPKSLYQLPSHKRSGVGRDCILAPHQLWHPHLQPPTMVGSWVVETSILQTAPNSSGSHPCDCSYNLFCVYLLSGIVVDNLGTSCILILTMMMQSKYYWPKFTDKETEAQGLGGPAPGPNGSFQRPGQGIAWKPSLAGKWNPEGPIPVTPTIQRGVS